MENQIYHERKRLRLAEYDYHSNGAYFITICTENKAKILCDIRPECKDGVPLIAMTPEGEAVVSVIEKVPGIDKYVIMPNHVHMILFNPKQQDISKTIQFFKVNCTRKIKRSIWQRSFYDHIIRDERDYLTRWKYIDENPAKWADDDYY